MDRQDENMAMFNAGNYPEPVNSVPGYAYVVSEARVDPLLADLKSGADISENDRGVLRCILSAWARKFFPAYAVTR